jgi:hypothetical protein
LLGPVADSPAAGTCVRLVPPKPLGEESDDRHDLIVDEEGAVRALAKRSSRDGRGYPLNMVDPPQRLRLARQQHRDPVGAMAELARRLDRQFVPTPLPSGGTRRPCCPSCTSFWLECPPRIVSPAPNRSFGSQDLPDRSGKRHRTMPGPGWLSSAAASWIPRLEPHRPAPLGAEIHRLAHRRPIDGPVASGSASGCRHAATLTPHLSPWS